MPSPHPSIMYGPEQEADGLKWPIEDRSPRDKFIWPLYIESALSSVKYGVEGIVTLRTAEVIEKVAGGLPKLSADQEALRDRLAARLKLSKQYMRKWRRVQAKVGVTALQDKMEKMTERQCAIEERILTRRMVQSREKTSGSMGGSQGRMSHPRALGHRARPVLSYFQALCPIFLEGVS